MYKWNKKEMLSMIIELNKIIPKDNDELLEIKYCINKLYNLIKYKQDNNDDIIEENEEYQNLIKHNNIMDSIIEKYIYFKIKSNNIISFHKLKHIYTSKKEIITITKDIINSINSKWYNDLSYIFNNPNLIDFNKNNQNCLHYITFNNKMFITLNKQNNIEDYLSPIHEFLHALTLLYNPNFLNNIECEFLSILGELILSYEMKNNNIYPKEFIKANINDLTYIIDNIHSIIFKRLAINSFSNPQDKIHFLNTEYDIPKSIIYEMYETSITYDYSTIISFFIALELFEIYKIDKEKCIYICEYLINNTDTILNKLSKNNISILNKDSTYIKKLKKEYTTYNQ